MKGDLVITKTHSLMANVLQSESDSENYLKVSAYIFGENALVHRI